MVMVLIKLPRWCVKGEKFLISSLKKNQQKKPTKTQKPLLIHLDRGKISTYRF